MKKVFLGILAAFFAVSIDAQDVENINRFGISMKISKPCIEKMDGSVNGGAGIRYNITDRCYTGVQLEYTQVQGRVESTKMDMNFVSVPFEIGYRMVERTYGFGISPFVGLGVNIATSGNVEFMKEKKSMEIGGDAGLDLRFGVNLIIGGCIEIGGRYHIPINTKQEEFFGQDSYFSVSLGVGLHNLF